MKTIHYTEGYGGSLNYHTTCGKEIHSHSDEETATIDPTQVDCAECKKDAEWIADECNLLNERPGIKRRLYIESDILSASELNRVKRQVSYLIETAQEAYVHRVFSEVLDYAWHDLERTWEAVKKADEIYADSSLMPIISGDYSGAPVIFNGMCERAVAENVTGKSVFILNQSGYIQWDMIDIPLMKKAFEKNSLFRLNDEGEMEKITTENFNEDY